TYTHTHRGRARGERGAGGEGPPWCTGAAGRHGAHGTRARPGARQEGPQGGRGECGVVWCGAVWCGVVWCGGVVRCGAVLQDVWVASHIGLSGMVWYGMV